MVFDAPTITALAGAVVTVTAGLGALLRLIFSNIAKRRQGISATMRQRDRDIIAERTRDKREISHLERQFDTEKRNRNRIMDRYVEARRKTMELYGAAAVATIFGDTPKFEETLSYDDIRDINDTGEIRRPRGRRRA